MIDEIQSLLARYCDLMDAGDWDGVGALFGSGCLVDDRGNEIARGAGAIADFFRRGTRTYDGSPRTKHLVLNTAVEAATSEEVVAASSFVVLQATDDLPLQPIVTGRYADRFVREGSEWRFEERAFAVDLLGDTSKHLTYEIR